MKREYFKWFSRTLSRDMEVLAFGHSGLPVIAFPTSCGRFFDFEDQGMIAAVSDRIEQGDVQMFCVDSVDAESWYNRTEPPRRRILRQIQYELYVMEEVLPFVQGLNRASSFGAIGCSFGGYHASNLAFRHPDVFTRFVAMGGAFDPSESLGSYFDDDCYFHLPLHHLPNLNDLWYLDRLRRGDYVIATGVDDICRESSERMAEAMRAKEIPCRFDVWGDHTGHDWRWWQQMIRAYL